MGLDTSHYCWSWIAAIALLLALFTAPAHASLLDAAVVGAATADVVTTEMALRQPGAYELNPLMQSPAARVGIKTAGIVAILATSHHLGTHGHRRASRVLRILTVVGWSAAAAHNLRVGRER